jgi:ATP-binding cassette subfamily B protein
VQNYINLRANLKYVNDFIDSLPDKEKISKKNKSNQNKLDGFKIEFKNIDFEVPGRKKKILNNVNFEIDEGESVAIMGNIGCGKSTIGKLLLGLQKKTEGNMFVGGVNTDDMDLKDIRNLIQYVPQSPVLFNRTLWENLSYGFKKGEVNEEKFISILETLDMNETAVKFKERMHKSVGKKGSMLSGGQRQITWLLRCLAKKSKIVVLDEPTSALDDNSRNNIMKLLNKLGENKTLIIITHDKDLLKSMTRLLYVEDGTIAKDKLILKETKF